MSMMNLIHSCCLVFLYGSRRITSMTDLVVKGVPVSHVVRRFGRVFDPAAPPPQKKTIGESGVNLFISHVWTSHPKARWLGLLWRVNASNAVLISSGFVLVLASVLMVTVDGRDWVPFEDSTKFTVFSCLALAGSAVLVLAFLFGHLLVGSRSCFLDRCCIEQNDSDKKLAGVRQIPAVLANAERLVVLLSEDYFERLWCCYEMAVFVSSGRNNCVDMVPLRSVFIVLVMTAFDLVSAVLFRSYFRSALAADDNLVFLVVSGVFGAISAGLTFGFAYLWQADLTRVRKQLTGFTLDSVKCSDEADRRALTLDIAERFNGVENFEIFVRTQVLSEIASRPRVKYLAFVCLPNLFAIIGYVDIMTQRLGLFCLKQIDSVDIIFRDDSFCSVLDRDTYENVLIMAAEIVSALCFYPVVVRVILAFINWTLRFATPARRMLQVFGFLAVAAATAITPGQFAGALIAHAIRAGVLFALAIVFIIVPRRPRDKNQSVHLNVNIKKVD